MPTLLKPCPVAVEVPCFNVDWPVNNIPMHTQLFREDWGLPETIGQVHERSEGREELVFVSAGCSTGAEADSLAALDNKIRDGGSLAIAAFDISQAAIEFAQSGEHLLPRVLYDDDDRLDLDEAEATLREYGFEFDFDTVHAAPYKWNEMGYHKIMAAPVRQGHDVQFMRADLTEGLPLERKVDAALAHNMLYHLKPEEATVVVRHLAGILRETGVLSIGGSSLVHPTKKKMGVRLGNRTTTFYDWVSRTTGMLKTDFGLEPIARGAADLPTRFSRT